MLKDKEALTLTLTKDNILLNKPIYKEGNTAMIVVAENNLEKLMDLLMSFNMEHVNEELAEERSNGGFGIEMSAEGAAAAVPMTNISTLPFDKVEVDWDVT